MVQPYYFIQKEQTDTGHNYVVYKQNESGTYNKRVASYDTVNDAHDYLLMLDKPDNQPKTLPRPLDLQALLNNTDNTTLENVFLTLHYNEHNEQWEILLEGELLNLFDTKEEAQHYYQTVSTVLQFGLINGLIYGTENPEATKRLLDEHQKAHETTLEEDHIIQEQDAKNFNNFQELLDSLNLSESDLESFLDSIDMPEIDITDEIEDTDRNGDDDNNSAFYF